MGKILIIAPFEIFPPYWGAANRIYNITKCLAADFRVTLLYVRYRQLLITEGINDPLVNSKHFRVTGITSFGKYSQIFNPLLIITGLLLSCRERYSFILAETGWAGLHALLLSLLTRIPYVLDEHNVEWAAFKRMNRGGKLGVFLLKFYERIICRFAYKLICVSEVDKELLASELNIPRIKIVVIPNSVDLERFHPDTSKRDMIRQTLGVPANAPLILFNGKLDYKPNHEAVEIISHSIMPCVIKDIPDAKFLVVGNNPPSESSHDSLIFTGTVDSIEDYINASDIVICPLLSGGGTRFKILEAIACGKRVISTTIGAEALIVKETETHLTCVNNWDQFALEVIKALREDIDTEPSEGFKKKYGWSQATQVLKSHVFS